MKGLTALIIGLLLSGCATFIQKQQKPEERLSVEKMQLNDAYIQKEWAEIEKIYNIKAELIPIRVVPVDLEENYDSLGIFFDDFDSNGEGEHCYIEIYSGAFIDDYDNLNNKLLENLVYNTIAHELIHYALDVFWEFKNPPNRPIDHCVMGDALKKLCDFNAKNLSGGDKSAEKITLDNLSNVQKKECHK
jgi:uncharacterized protein YceK